jgi:hypothetical protein
MAKLLLLIILLTLFEALVYSQGQKNNPNQIQLENIIQKGEINNINELSNAIKYSSTLNISDRTSLYNKYEKNIGTSFIGFSLNTFILPSLGSFIIGDTAGGIRSAIGIGSSGLLLGLGLYGIQGVHYVNSPNFIYFQISMGMAIVGLAGFLVFETINIFSPFYYVPDWNDKLKSGLNISLNNYNSQFKQYCMNSKILKNDLININILFLEF